MLTSAGLSTLAQPEKMLPDIRITLWKWDCLGGRAGQGRAGQGRAGQGKEIP